MNERNLRIRINNKHEHCLDTNTEKDLLATLIRYKCEKYGEKSATGEDDAQATMSRLDKTLKSIVFTLKSYSYSPSEASEVLQESHTSKGITDVCEALQVFPPEKLAR
ncbi:hypothetical protein IH992_03685 [Candidatus Poribacteria bacterium]|nr:hypothetical protein [Candidatus Poribacteria bacterium]